MESATKKSLLGKYQLITEVKQNRPNNNKPQQILLNLALTIQRPFFVAPNALWLIWFSLNEIPPSGCDSSFTLLSIASSPGKVILGTNVQNSSKYTTMVHTQLFQCPFNNSKSISCRWYCQCSLEYFHLYKTHLRLATLWCVGKKCRPY